MSFCGCPSSSTVKSSRVRSVTGRPWSSVAITSRITRRVLDRMTLCDCKTSPLVCCGDGDWEKANPDSKKQEVTQTNRRNCEYRYCIRLIQSLMWNVQEQLLDAIRRGWLTEISGRGLEKPIGQTLKGKLLRKL